MLKVFIIFFILFFNSQAIFAQETEIEVNYLGHSSFVLIFDDTTSILIDYGQPNPYVEYGLDSPIYTIGSFIPTAVTYSNKGIDHCDPDRIDTLKTVIIHNNQKKLINNVECSSQKTSENSESDNYAYIFKYKGINIVHLGDCQTELLSSEAKKNINAFKHKLPDTVDILFIPIENKHQYKEQAVRLIEEINPKTVFPMHYWHETFKEEFLEYVNSLNKGTEKKFKIISRSKAKYNVKPLKVKKQILVIDLIPSELKY